MSRTRKQIGKPEGGAKVDPESFSNPGQCGPYTQPGHKARAATDPQFTKTSGNDTADGVVKDSASPHVGSLDRANGAPIRTVRGEVPPGAWENRGK